MSNRERWTSPGQTRRVVRDVENPAFSILVAWPPDTPIQVVTRRSTPFEVDGEVTDGIGVALDEEGVDALIFALQAAKRSRRAGGAAS